MIKSISRFWAMGGTAPNRFVKIVLIWLVLGLISLSIDLVLRKYPDGRLFALGLLALFGPFVLVTLKGLPRLGSLYGAFVHCTWYLLSGTYLGIALKFDVQIWIGRLSIGLGFILSLLALFVWPS